MFLSVFLCRCITWYTEFRAEQNQTQSICLSPCSSRVCIDPACFALCVCVLWFFCFYFLSYVFGNLNRSEHRESKLCTRGVYVKNNLTFELTDTWSSAAGFCGSAGRPCCTICVTAGRQQWSQWGAVNKDPHITFAPGPGSECETWPAQCGDELFTLNWARCVSLHLHKLCVRECVCCVFVICILLTNSHTGQMWGGGRFFLNYYWKSKQMYAETYDLNTVT